TANSRHGSAARRAHRAGRGPRSREVRLRPCIRPPPATPNRSGVSALGGVRPGERTFRGRIGFLRSEETPMYYVIGANGSQYGPVDEATIRAWVAEGR